MASQPTYAPFAQPAVGSGVATQIAEGILWLRMPMEGPIEAINVWALADGDGWTIVDTGMRSAETAAAWRCAFAHTLEGRPVRRIIATHCHPDHSGMVGWLVQEQPAHLWMTRLEYLTLRMITANIGHQLPDEDIPFYVSAGWERKDIDQYRAHFDDLSQIYHSPPVSFNALKHGDQLAIGGRQWRIVVGTGHSPEHAMLHCAEASLLISGDQVLPTISSNVMVQPTEPAADPMTDWIASLHAIRRYVPDDVLVLPAHGKPFHGLHERLDTLRQTREDALERLVALLETPCRAIDTFPALFKRQIQGGLLGLATGESLAYLACLRARGLASSEVNDRGIRWWKASGAMPSINGSGPTVADDEKFG